MNRRSAVFGGLATTAALATTRGTAAALTPSVQWLAAARVVMSAAGHAFDGAANLYTGLPGGLWEHAGSAVAGQVALVPKLAPSVPQAPTDATWHADLVAGLRHFERAGAVLAEAAASSDSVRWGQGLHLLQLGADALNAQSWV